jgi:hypothetical protein
MVDVKREDLDTVMRIRRIDIGLDRVMRIGRIDAVLGPAMRRGKTDTVPDPVMKTGRTDNVQDPMKKEVTDIAQHTETIGKFVNLPDRDSTEKKRKDGDHVTTAIHHLDQNRVNLLGMVFPNRDLGRGKIGMIGIDAQ